MLGALHLDLGDGAPLEAREQNAAQTVADRDAEPALERLGSELAVGARVTQGEHAFRFFP